VWPGAPFRDSERSSRFILGLCGARLRLRLPLNSVLPAKLRSAGNLRAGRAPEQRVEYALHEITRCGRQDRIAVLGILMFLVAALPTARAQIVPVSFVHKTAGDSKIPSWVVLAPLPHSELRRAVKPALPKSFFVLSAEVYTAAELGMQLSESTLPHFNQRDPVVRPFLRLPAPAYYASAALFATGINFLRWKMARSERWHKIWWLPQVGSMAGNLAGSGYTRAHPAPH